jgi:hypothetical protein
MPRLNEIQRAALGYWWNLVTDAVQQGFTTTETTQIASQIAKDLGGNVTFKEAQAIATLYGYASRINTAATVFQNAPQDYGITSNMIATAPYARDEREQNSYPLYHVSFYYTYLDQAGNEQTSIRTSVQPMRLAGTVGGVWDDVELDALGMAQKYNHTLISAIPFQILAV